jgi:Uma2 family endonuclease
MLSAEIAPKLWTRQEYDRLIALGVFEEDDNIELIGGVLYLMTPQNSRHASVSGKLHQLLQSAFGPGFVIRVQMPFVIDPDSEPEPDLVVVKGAHDDYFDRHPQEACLIVEVAESSLRFDLGEKRVLYARARVPEYWVVDLLHRRLEVFRDPKAPATGGDDYELHHQYGAGQSVAPLLAPGSTIAIDALFPRRGA